MNGVPPIKSTARIMNVSEPVRRLPFALPESGVAVAVAPGVFWVRLSLPFKLDHVNIWLIEDGGGWTVVDTGIHTAACREVWETLLRGPLGGRPIVRIVVTHFHPDHIGMAGRLVERFDAPLWMPEQEWRMARLIAAPFPDEEIAKFLDFYRRAGFPPDLEDICRDRVGNYARCVSPIPDLTRPLAAGDTITIGGRGWRVRIGTGHSPEHACLFCEELGVLISGDQVLPEISPNVSVVPREASVDPLGDFLASLSAFLDLPASTRVLPSHRWPFEGLHERVRVLLHHHDARLEATLRACERPRDGLGVLKVLFDRELDNHQLFFAIGETLAHLHHLIHRGRIRRIEGDGGVYLYERTAAS